MRRFSLQQGGVLSPAAWQVKAALVGALFPLLWGVAVWSDDVDWSGVGESTLPAAPEASLGQAPSLPSGTVPVYQKPFQLKNLFKKPEPKVDVDKLIQVGPRRYAVTAGVLLRVTQPLCPALGERVLPGMVLAQWEESALRLSQGAKTFATVPLVRYETVPDSQASSEQLPTRALEVTLTDDDGVRVRHQRQWYWGRLPRCRL
ncbi:MAG: hypothetical protein U0003_04895 [Vampirovibrionales bacterium]